MPYPKILPFLRLSRMPDCSGSLYDSLASLLDAKLSLFRNEVWEEGPTLLSGDWE